MPKRRDLWLLFPVLKCNFKPFLPSDQSFRFFFLLLLFFLLHDRFSVNSVCVCLVITSFVACKFNQKVTELNQLLVQDLLYFAAFIMIFIILRVEYCWETEFISTLWANINGFVSVL